VIIWFGSTSTSNSPLAIKHSLYLGETYLRNNFMFSLVLS
jgi:hypothetical protein